MNKAPANKFNIDLLWNLSAFGGIVVLGILLNILIIKFYDSSVLGVFNQVYAVYILFSQLAVGGVHLSVQYFTPRFAASERFVAQILISALAIASLFSVLTILIGYLSSDLIGSILDSPKVTEGLYYTLWGLIFFSFNKILLASKNGLRQMKTFAVGQLLRFVFIFFGFLTLSLQEFNPVFLPSILAIAEALLFIFLAFASLSDMRHYRRLGARKVFLLQFKFGNSAFTGNILLDVNTKVDVCTLGIFLSDAKVGVYSLAATIAEGFMQLPVLYRNNLNPILTRLYLSRNLPLKEKVLKKNIRSAYKYLSILGLLSIAVFPIIPYLFEIEEAWEAFAVYAILIGGIVITSGYQPLLMIFNQLGRPQLQTWYFFLIFLSNVIFNFSLVPFIGINGAAIGTSLSFLVQVAVLKYYLAKKFKLNV